MMYCVNGTCCINAKMTMEFIKLWSNFSMLETFDTLQCPIKSVFDILTLAEAPIDVLFGLAQAKTTPEFNEMIVESLLFGKELKGEQRYESNLFFSTNQFCSTNDTYVLNFHKLQAGIRNSRSNRSNVSIESFLKKETRPDYFQSISKQQCHV